MHQLLEEYLKKKEIEKNKLSLEKKNNLLLELGLYEKEYSNSEKYSDEYPDSEKDNQTKKTKYYKKVPIEVSDEEFAKILKYQNEKQDKKTNRVKIIFKIIGWAIIVYGIAKGIDFISPEISVAITYWFTSISVGMFFLGFAEIIQLLTDIKNK